MPIEFRRVVPILRIFSIEKAKEFYVEFLGFSVDWEHRFDANAPIYMQISRGSLTLHLSELYGDCCPGTTVVVDMAGLDEFHGEITSRNYKYLRPGIRRQPWNAKCMEVIDPFGNRIRFNEYLEPTRVAGPSKPHPGPKPPQREKRSKGV